MPESSFVAHVREQLASLKGISCRAMFGGHGLFAYGAMFGIVYDGQLFLRASGELAASEQEAGWRPFQPRPGMILNSYIEVSDDLLDDGEALCVRARAAMIDPGSRVAKSSRRY